MLHAGIINEISNERKVLQFKVVHEEDLDIFKDLNDIQIVKDSQCGIDNKFEYFFRLSSLHLAWLINGVIYPLTQKKYDDDNKIFNFFQKQIPLNFYNNES